MREFPSGSMDPFLLNFNTQGKRFKEKKGFAQKRLGHFLGKVHGKRMKEPMILFC
jgi:hypothetical protein